ncbi:transposase [Streptomyces sp. CA-106110]|uniref:transposase n=1 Tax=Streptomyces sp. CA-106110 TaxID=3240044 RepID=UPI003D8C8100
MIDSQSVKTDAVVGAESRGFDGGKLVNGRKRNVVVDTLGLLLGVMVTVADTGGRTAAHVLLGQVVDVHHRLEPVWADGGCTGSLVEHWGLVLERTPVVATAGWACVGTRLSGGVDVRLGCQGSSRRLTVLSPSICEGSVGARDNLPR